MEDLQNSHSDSDDWESLFENNVEEMEAHSVVNSEQVKMELRLRKVMVMGSYSTDENNVQERLEQFGSMGSY